MTKKVIIIDDSSVQLNILKTKFSNEFWQIFTIKDSIEAYTKIYKIAPDLIITDAIMPHVSGFELIKTIRNDSKLSNIPIIVYSVLPENNVGLYLNKKRPEFFFSKENSAEELVKFASETCEKHPVSEEEKQSILETKPEKIEENIKKYQQVTLYTIENLREALKTIDYSFDFKKTTLEIFNHLYLLIDYNLATLNLQDNEEENILYFDIRNIIVSPILQSAILKEQGCKTSVLNKQYAPNMKIIHVKEDFLSKLELNFEYLDKQIGKISLYSLKPTLQKEEDSEQLKELLFNFFRTRYIKKNIQKNKNEKYQSSSNYKIDKEITQNDNTTTYCAIIKIVNYQNLETFLSVEDIDILNIKITQTITQYIENDEKIFKEADDEYGLIIREKENNQAQKRLKSLNDALNSLIVEGFSIKSLIGVSNCNIDGKFNLKEAQKIALQAIETLQTL